MHPPLRLDPAALMGEITAFQRKLAAGMDNLKHQLEPEYANTPRELVYREDKLSVWRMKGQGKPTAKTPTLIVYALVNTVWMTDLQEDRSMVRNLLEQGEDIYLLDWGYPDAADRWLGLDDYINGYLDRCVDAVCKQAGVDAINLLGICQGGVFTTCYAALFPHKVKNLVLTVTPIDFHGDKKSPENGVGYMNLWARSLTPEDIDLMVDTMGTAPGAMVGLSFLMMNPIGNVTKYTTELVEILDDEAKLLNFLHMERWIADRPGHPGEVMRQWFKDLYQDNKLVRNELVLGGRRVDLRNITMPVLNVYAQGDVIVPNACSISENVRFGTSDYMELAVPGGHIGTFVGGKAQKILAPSIAQWLKERTP